MYLTFFMKKLLGLTSFDHVFGDNISNIYLISTATVFLAIILSVFIGKFFTADEHEHDGEADDTLTEQMAYEPEVCYKKLQNMVNEHLETNERGSIGEEFTPEGSFSGEDLSADDGDSGADDYDEDMSESDGFVGKLKSNRIKELESQLTLDQLEEERRIERDQLAAIFELLKKQELELNMTEIDESELNAQMSLYR